MQIELTGVCKRFGRAEVLKGVTTRVPEGGRVALIGPNGSGKSTLIRALLGLVACEGQVLLDGRSPYEDRVSLAHRFAYVPQVAPQLSATVEEVLRTIATTRGLPETQIATIADALELHLAPIRRRPFRNLSGGMKQKLLLASALAARPALLVLDEPTASLDARARERFFSLMEAVPERTTVLLCSHRLEELQQLATHVLALDEGRVSYDGPAAKLVDGSGRSMVEILLEVQAQEVLDA